MNNKTISQVEAADDLNTNQEQEEVTKKIPLLLKIFGVLCIALGIVASVVYSLLIVGWIYLLATSHTGTAINNVMVALYIIATLTSNIMFIILGVRLLRNKREKVIKISLWLLVVIVAIMLIEMMLDGFQLNLLKHLVSLALLIALMTYLDPALIEERALQRKLRKMDRTTAREERAKAWTLKKKRGFIPLNFYNIFWVFTVCCVIGLVLETIYHAVIFGGYQNRTGMLFGPFSPIYGFGALLMTIALNRFHNKPIIVIFLVSALVGGAFEYFTSWFMELAFGVTAWDYTGTFLSIDGRTNGMFMAMWGCLGLAWIKLFLPALLKLIDKIPWNWRYAVTTTCCALMLLDGAMTLMALGCWAERESGNQPETTIEQFYDDFFPDEWMANHFQTMTIDPEKTTNLSA